MHRKVLSVANKQEGKEANCEYPCEYPVSGCNVLHTGKFTFFGAETMTK